MEENKSLKPITDKYVNSLAGEELIKFFIDLAIMNIEECKQTLYNVFLKLKKQELLYKFEEIWIDKLTSGYEKTLVFPSLSTLVEFNYIPLKDDIFDKLKKRYSQDSRFLDYILNTISEKRKLEVFMKRNKKDFENACKTSNLPMELLYRVQDLQNEQFSLLSRKEKVYNEFKLDYGIPHMNAIYNRISAGSIINVIKNKSADNFFEVSVVYNTLINENKNICVITPSWNKHDIVFKLLTLHSQTLEEDKKLNYKKILEGTENLEKIQEVYSDFITKIGHHLQVLCNTSLEIFNSETFQKLISESNKFFTNTTGRPLEMLVIDSIENFRFEKNGIIEDNTTKIMKEYCSLLIREAKMFSKNEANPLTVLISTNVCSKATQKNAFIYDLYEEYVKDFETGTNLMEKYADLVILIANQRKTSSSEQTDGIIQVIKSQNIHPMVEPIQIITSICNCNIRKIQGFFQEDNNILEDFMSSNFLPEFSTHNLLCEKTSQKQ